MSSRVVFSKQAQEDARNLAAAGLKGKAQKLLAALEQNPFRSLPACEKLVGDLGAYSRRINIQRRLVYQVLQADRTIKVLRMWTHYE